MRILIGVGSLSASTLVCALVGPAAHAAPPTPDHQAQAVLERPVVSDLSLSQKKIRKVGSTSNVPRKTKLRLTLNVSALVRIRVKEDTPGSRGPAFNVAMPAGANMVELTARIGGTKLRPGLYQVLVKAHNESGTSAKKMVRFRVVA